MKDFFWKLNGYDMRKSRKFLKDLEKLPKEIFWDEQIKRRESIFQYHYRNTPWYQKYLGKLKNFKWEDVPVIKKEDYQEYSSMPSANNSKYKLYFANTSGASGEPFSFCKDKYCHSLAWAKNQISYYNLGISSIDKEARFFGNVKDSKGTQLYEFCKDFFLNRHRLNIFDNSEKNFINYINLFKKNKFVYIYGYTNVILEFSKFILSNKLNPLFNYCSTLKYCIVTAEMCSMQDRSKIENAIGVPVYNEYGTSETSIIAIEDKQFNWKISTDRLWIEILDEDNKPLKNGKSGKIVITDLFNKAFPFIRYEIGDIGSLEEYNEFPYLLLKELSGRISDTIHLPSGKKSPGLSFYYVTRSIFEKSTNIREFKIIQKDIDLFSFQIVSKQDLNEDEKKIIIDETEKYLESGLNITFEIVENIQNKYSGKNQHFFSELHDINKNY